MAGIRSKKKLGFLIFIIVILVGLIVAVWTVLFTRVGAAYVVKKISSSFSDKKEVVWQKNEGSFIGGMVYEDVELEDIDIMPKPNKLKIQKVSVKIKALSLNSISVSLENARLILPGADPVLAYGSLVQGSLDLNVYSKSISTGEIENLVSSIDLKQVTGELSDVDLRVKGTLSEPDFEGGFVIDKLSKNGFSLENSTGTLSLTMKEEKGLQGLFGNIILQNGTISGQKTAVILLGDSKIIFSGDPQKPGLDIKGTSQVSNIKIQIALKGTFDNPDLQLRSDPPMEKNRILLALATNKTWKNTEDVLNKGALSMDIAKDFIDYFVFGGHSNKFAKRFGLTSLSVKYDGEAKGVAVTKKLFDNLDGKYEVEETKSNDSQVDISQKVGGDVKITDRLSLEANKVFKQKYIDDQQDIKTTDDQLLLKYKKSF